MAESIPLRERLLDRMGDLLFCVDDLLTMIDRDENRHQFKHWEKSLRGDLRRYKHDDEQNL
jgi:hypothetical protein